MMRYKIYRIDGFCDAEWKHLGEVQADGVTDVLPQVRQQWPEYPHDLLVACTLDSVLPLTTVKSEPLGK